MDWWVWLLIAWAVLATVAGLFLGYVAAGTRKRTREQQRRD